MSFINYLLCPWNFKVFFIKTSRLLTLNKLHFQRDTSSMLEMGTPRDQDRSTNAAVWYLHKQRSSWDSLHAWFVSTWMITALTWYNKTNLITAFHPRCQHPRWTEWLQTIPSQTLLSTWMIPVWTSYHRIQLVPRYGRGTKNSPRLCTHSTKSLGSV